MRAGLTTHGFDINPEAVARFQLAGGAQGAFEDVAQTLEAVVVVVVNAAQTEGVLFGEAGIAPKLARGTVVIACVSSEGGENARKRIEELTADVEVGRIYDGTVLKLLDFGAIVSVLPGRDGLLHISQIANERVNSVADHLKEGQAVRVKVLEADEKGRLRLSMKAVAAAAETQTAQVE